jgi:alpha-amylase
LAEKTENFVVLNGDIKGISKKIDEGYFDKLGINAIWFSLLNKYMMQLTKELLLMLWLLDERLDERPHFGTKEDLAALLKKAHAHGIRIILDVCTNTGPVTDIDTVWPSACKNGTTM